jgi:eukaryotic-like serine/threonine-protein kinase
MENSQAPEVPGFAVGRLLGAGGSASVWLAREQRTGRDFALKCFRTGVGGPKGAETMTEDAVRREIRILSVLDHPHLVKAHDAVRLAGLPEGRTALVMDYAPGGSLAAVVASRGRLSVGETVTVLTPVAQALAYLHSRGFTHSDVSPGNVLFTGQGKPLLSDVGVARMLGDPEGASGSGTPGFVDPAPVDAVRGLQPERDVYSTAALGWFCLTGQAPPRTADRPPLSLLVPEVPRELAAALEAGLNDDRRARPAAAALATAVYRSASPQPLDLAASVHPTVIPELVTRRHRPAVSRAGAVKEKYQAAGRRIGTARWARPLFSTQRMPFPQAGSDRHPSGGKHSAEAPGRGPGRAAPLRRIRPAAALLALALLAVAAAWWISGTVKLPAEPSSAPDSVQAHESVEGQESVTGQESVVGQESVAGPEPVAGHGTDTARQDAAAGEEGSAAPEPEPASAGAGTGDGLAVAARQQARAPDPVQAVRGLAALRDLAFSTGDLGLLGEVNVDGSPAAITDERTSERLRSSGHVLAGFSSTLADLRTEEGATPAQAVVRVHSGSSAYEEKDARGSVVGTGSAGSGRQLRLVLVAVDGAWRISEILPGD